MIAQGHGNNKILMRSDGDNRWYSNFCCTQQSPLLDIYNTIKDLAVSYSGIILQYPEVFVTDPRYGQRPRICDARIPTPFHAARLFALPLLRLVFVSLV